MKKCSMCKCKKPLSNFSKNMRNKDGLQYECKKCQSEYLNSWQKKNSCSHKKYQAEWRKKNPEKVRESKIKYRKKMSKKIKYRLNQRMTTRVRFSLKNSKSGRKWELLVGYTVNQLKINIENKFITGMSWENMGEWHIDHKIPISAFNFSDVNDIDFKRCWALKNLQPLWAKDNLSKHKKLDRPFQPSLSLKIY